MKTGESQGAATTLNLIIIYLDQFSYFYDYDYYYYYYCIRVLCNAY